MERLILFNLRQPDPNKLTSKTTMDQAQTQSMVRKSYYERLSQWKDSALKLFKRNHINYLKKCLYELPNSFESLDASQPWLSYWILHPLMLLNYTLTDREKKDICAFIKSTQHPDGGFGGGPYQYAHLATTYGAVNCLAMLCDHEALSIIDRPALANWLRKLHQPNGSFIMHVGGEEDVRGIYCASAVASLTGLLKKDPKLFEFSAEWIAKCQSYEGGFGARPGVEAHGGYSFCCIAALCLLGRTDLIDLPRLLNWVAHMQMASEGGFQGRANKLVDSCYSFWQGGIFPICENILWKKSDPAMTLGDTLFNPSALQEYILLCCQKVSYTPPGLSIHSDDDQNPDSTNISNNLSCGGGLIDKPGKHVDPYHTCYGLSGLSLAQHSPRLRPTETDEPFSSRPTPAVEVVGEELGNELNDLNPVHNIIHTAVQFTRTYFDRIDSGLSEEEANREAVESLKKCELPPVEELASDSFSEKRSLIDTNISVSKELDNLTCT